MGEATEAWRREGACGGGLDIKEDNVTGMTKPNSQQIPTTQEPVTL